ncbi:Mus7/MMS22 family-domain-containing protein [Aspergillus pseudoustus]|uniref:Mus7/MMS22 family-domain-containing protein n=1 Tax=Aspergillus pseudoustus TaxID=1810923 RepID=A0ABR4IM26_9EURO
MESWRERGFVPDSDDEDGFESQEKKGSLSGTGTGDTGRRSHVEVVLSKPAELAESHNDEGDAQERDDRLDDDLESLEGDLDEVHALGGTAEIDEDDEIDLPLPVGRLQTPVDNQDKEERKPPAVEDNRFVLDRKSPSPRSRRSTTADRGGPSSTPRPKKQRDIWDMPSSSPDLLVLDHKPRRKQSSPRSMPTPKAKFATQPCPQEETLPSSPLSSLSSLHSSALDINNEQGTEELSDQPLNELLPPLEIPEDIIRELDPPTKRSLRQRNPIQLHPYLLEDAKYQHLMKARGIKPVRVVQHEQRTRPAEESQGQGFGDDAASTSDTRMTDLHYIPSSPVDTRQLPEITQRDGAEKYTTQNVQNRHRSKDGTEPRSPKRRRVIGPEDNRQRQKPRPSHPQAVIKNTPSSSRLHGTALLDFPSPPRSGSVSSPSTYHRTEFRFPPGFTPPTITPRTEARAGTEIGHDGNTMADERGSVVNQDFDDAQSVKSVASHSSTNADTDGDENDGEDDEEQDVVEAAVRRLQRKIRGVLPASWLRLDQQKQRERLSATQAHQDRVSRMESEATKGVAKRITKKADYSAPSSARGHFSSLRQLADESSEESGGDPDGNGSMVSPRRPADLFDYGDSFHDQDPTGDIPEDNRIDYMFPLMSRNRTLPEGRKPAKKCRKLDAGHTRQGSQSKRPRMKRQARLTDPVYDGRKTKQSSPHLPKLSILDASDVASRSREEQPQFLRVAARKARSRQDRGRRSPTRKVIKLSSRLDTEEANVSLRDWRAGRLRQTKLPKPPAQIPRRQPLLDLSTNAREISNNLRTKRREDSRNTQHAAPVRANSAVRENAPPSDSPSDNRPTNTDTTLVRPAHQRRGNAWVIQRNLAITSLSRNNPRPVAPEVANHIATRAPASLRGSLALLNGDRNLLLNRYLAREVVRQKTPQIAIEKQTTIEKDKLGHDLQNQTAGPRHRHLKKRPPKRVDITALEDQAPLTFPTPEPASLTLHNRVQLPQGLTTEGLNSFKTAYPIDFEVVPLHAGVFFHESTFIGSGEFARSLSFSGRDLDKSIGPFYFELGDNSMKWGAWDDNVSSQFSMVFDNILGSLGTDRTVVDLEKPTQDSTSSGCAAFRYLVKYITEHLTFIDPIDRAGFVTRVNGLVAKLLEDFANVMTSIESDMEQPARVASYNAVLANQCCQIACHPLVKQSVQDEALQLAKVASKQVIALISNQTGQEGVRKFLVASKSCEWREAGIKDDHPSVEAYILVQQILCSADRYRGCLESFVAETYSLGGAGISNKRDITGLESGWRRVFTTLPLQDFDALGITHAGSRFKRGHDNWTVVKRLLKPVFDSVEANTESQPISYYSYCRVLLTRCFILINGWGWRDCKPILDTLYDFFAKRTLYNLRLEESFKSPAFLDELDNNPSFEVLPNDSCFHILLKIIASGLRFLAKAYDGKKIRNFTWRLLPNHGREYPKEQSIRQADLDALRNHHDLICTLYSSVPEECRPQLKAIKNLIHPASAHRETCKISLRSWTRLARFKLATNEDVSGLQPFAEWHGYFMTEFLKQHSLARREIEAQNDGAKQFSQQLIDRTISQNQWQIESLMKTALQGMQNAIKSARTVEHAHKIVSETPIGTVLGLFNAQVHRINATVLEALQVIAIYVQKCNSLAPGSSPSRIEDVPTVADEDSQDYGDWTDIAAAYGYENAPISTGIEHVEKVFHPAVSRLVSNCFGEDRCPDDVILMGAVDCWTSIAHILIRNKLRSWDSYIGPYGTESWVALRRTIQTRKFTAQFLAKCIENDGQFVSECKVQIFGMWLSSLVERVSMLKFQHCLTEAILNHDAKDPVLQNLPFSRDSKTGRYSITFLELSQRRLSLVSSLLSNMRTHIQHLDDTGSRELSTTRQEYGEILQTMMASMKANYQELGNGEADLRGAYVEFVQSIVGFLQQHTRDICPIDAFFTNPTSFPLPSTDPTYIVARLKGYEPKLSSVKVVKTLIIFIQSVSERAALDGEQQYLVNQLYDSMKESHEVGNPDQPTLRATLLQCVFPAYLATSFDNPAAWVLSRPIIETTTRVFQTLLFNIDAADPNCVRSVFNMFGAIFGSSYNALLLLINDAHMLKEPAVLFTATAFLQMITFALPVADYMDRLAIDTTSTSLMIAHIRAFEQFAVFTTSYLQTPPQSPPNLDHPPRLITQPSNSIDISLSATRELQTYLSDNWSRHQGRYYFTRRGHQPQEVTIEPPIAAKLDQFPERGLLDAARSFLDALDRLDLFGEFDDHVYRLVDSGSTRRDDSEWADEELMLF